VINRDRDSSGTGGIGERYFISKQFLRRGRVDHQEWMLNTPRHQSDQSSTVSINALLQDQSNSAPFQRSYSTNCITFQFWFPLSHK